MLCSCVFLYAMKHWNIISFTEGESRILTSNPITLVPLKTLFHTLPLAVSYLLYMVCIGGWIFTLNCSWWNFNFSSNCSFLLACLVKVNHHGIYSWHKCSDVYHPKTDYCGFYHDRGVSFNRTETLIICCWLVWSIFICYFRLTICHRFCTDGMSIWSL